MIPGFTILLPFIGHVGIADQYGKIHSHQGPFSLLADFSYQKVHKYTKLELKGVTHK
jgi:hypothetical protein